MAKKSVKTISIKSIQAKLNGFLYDLKRVNKKQKLKFAAIIGVFVVILLLTMFNNKPIYEFFSNILNKNETINYAEVNVFDAEIYTSNEELLKEYNQDNVEDTTIEKVNIKLKFDIDSQELYKNGKWQGNAIYQLPSNVKAIADNAKGLVYSNDIKVGTFVANEDNIVFNFDEGELESGNIIYGDFSFWGEINFSDLKYSSNYRIEFSKDAYYDVDIKLCTSLELGKKVSEPIVDQKNSTIRFDYEITLYSPASTNSEELTIEDNLTTTEKDEEKVKWSNLKIVWTDKDGKEKEIPENYKLTRDSINGFTGTLPAMESGDTIKITYSVTEVSSSITNKTYQETNTVTVKTKDEKINLNAKVESLVSKFVGDKWYDLKIKKSIDSEKSEETETNTKYYYEVEVSSTIGTLGHEIDFSDITEIPELPAENTATLEDLKVLKIKEDGTEESLTNKNYLKIEDKKITGTLPALIKGEKYLISYYLTIDREPTDEFEITNTASVTSKHAHAEDILKSSSFLEEKLKIDIDAKYKANSPCNTMFGCGNNLTPYTANAEFEVTINTEHNLIKPYFEIDAYFNGKYNPKMPFSYPTTFEFYDADTNEMYTSQVLELPIHFVAKNDGFYAVDAKGQEVKMNSTRDILKLKYKYNSMASYIYFVTQSLDVIITSNGRETIKFNGNISTDVFNQKFNCGSCGGSSGMSYCLDIHSTISKRFISKTEASNNVFNATWGSKININIDGKLDRKPFTITEVLSSSVENSHYYTKEQLDKIKIYGVKNDNSQIEIPTEKYTIKGTECTKNIGGYTYSCKDLTDDYSDAKFNGLKITFNDDFENENYEKITYETTSTIDMTDVQFGNFTSNISILDNYSSTYMMCPNGYVSVSFNHKNFSPEIDDVIEKYIYNEDGTTTKEKDVSYNEDGIYYKVELNKDGTLDGEITYTDELPKGMELNQNSWKYGTKSFYSYGFNKGIYLESSNIEKDNFSYVSSSYYTVTYDKDTRKLTVTIPETVYHNYSNNSILKLNLYYKVNIVGEFDKDTALINKGKVKANGEKSSSATANIISAKFNKQFVDFNEAIGELKYGVKINETGKKLLDGNKIKVVDTLKYPLSKDKIESIELKTVKLYALKNNEKGEKIADLEFETKDIENGIEFEIEIPDEQALYLEYTYKITLTNNYPDHLDISNEIMIKGSTEGWAKDSLSSRTDITGITAHAYTNGVVLTLSKIDGNAQKLLAGATYKVERYTGKEWKSIGKFTTNEDGTIEIGEKTKNGKKFLFQNVAYRVKEVKAPTGYKLDSNYNYIYVYNPLINREIIPKGFDKNNIVNKDKVATLVDYIINVPTNDIINFIVVIFLILSIVGIVILFIRPRTRYEITK